MARIIYISFLLSISTLNSKIRGTKLCGDPVCVSKDLFGYLDNNKTQPIYKFTWHNSNNVKVEILNYGVTLNRILLPDRNGVVDDILLGYDDIKGYTSSNNPYFGATIGRVANRIANGEFTLDNVTYHLPKNLGNNTIHGGTKGFSKYAWNYLIKGTQVIFTMLSPDGDQGFPGDVLVTVIVELTELNELRVEICAGTSKKTPINLTNHAYFNLGGQASGPSEILNHIIKIESNAITEANDDGIPTGKFLDVNIYNEYDFRIPSLLKDKFVIHPEGFDNNFVIERTWDALQPRFMASALHPPSGRFLELYSNQPGCQFFTAGNLPSANETNESKLIFGKDNHKYSTFGAFCFEPQAYPDSVNHPNFPNTIVAPGEMYVHKIIYRLGAI